MDFQIFYLLLFIYLHLKFCEFSGHWSPKHCKARQKVAVLVPYRDRKDHLKIFLLNMHPFLQNQLLDYTIFVIEQVCKTTLHEDSWCLIQNIKIQFLFFLLYKEIYNLRNPLNLFSPVRSRPNVNFLLRFVLVAQSDKFTHLCNVGRS